MHIKLNTVIPISNLPEYKMHLACWNGENQPLDVFVKSRDEWEQWNTWRGQKDEFNREYIFSLIDFYPEADTWLFGGVYKVMSRGTQNYAHSYKVKLVESSTGLIGRLKIRFKRPARAKAVRLENYYDHLVVSEILKECYSGETFGGYENINLDFRKLELIVKNGKQDWKAALENVKGVYLITDKSNGKRYVGSAYGDSGIWSRWACYVGTGHGWNDELTKLIRQEGIEHAQKHFQITLLEYRSMKTDDNAIIARECYWKDVLLSRGQFGYNKN
jgi:hypothetical protein